MRTLLIWLLLCSTALAIEDEVYVGQYVGANTARACPDGEEGKYIAGVEIGEHFGRFNPFVRIETIMDEYVSGGGFHPISVRYDLGIEVDIYKGIALEFEHSCWHPVDRGGTAESYNLLLLKYKFGD